VNADISGVHIIWIGACVHVTLHMCRQCDALIRCPCTAHDFRLTLSNDESSTTQGTTPKSSYIKQNVYAKACGEMWKDWMGSTFLEMFEGQVQVIMYSQCLSPLQNDYLYHEPTNKRVQILMH
jgi:hypothetical protein